MSNVLLITPTSNQVVGFRKKLIEKLQIEGNNVSVITFDSENEQVIKERNIDFHCIKDNNRSINPFKILSLKNKIYKIIEKIKPNIVLTFMLKPNIFGVLASKKAKIENTYSFIEGAGDVFINNTVKWKLIRLIVCFLYKKAFKHNKKVFFLNNDDKQEFINRKLVKENQCELINGIGVDVEYFEYKPLINYNKFLMVARMLKTKGVIEYCKCAKIVKQKYPNVEFNYLGAEGTLTLADIQEYIDDGSINYFGTTNDIRPYLEESLLLLLSSYREGLPMSIMEAEAVGRAIITSNGVGCKDTVIDGYNGFICNQGDYEAMAEKVIWCIEHPSEVEKMCKNARKFAEENFNCNLINAKVYMKINE